MALSFFLTEKKVREKRGWLSFYRDSWKAALASGQVQLGLGFWLKRCVTQNKYDMQNTLNFEAHF